MYLTPQREKSGDVVVSGSSSGGSVVATGSSGVGVVSSVGATSASSSAMASSLTSGLTPGGHGGHMGEEPSDLEELEQFARTFKQRRIKLGFTQVKDKIRGRWTGMCVCVCESQFHLWPHSSVRETSAWPWANCTATTSARPPSPDLKHST